MTRGTETAEEDSSTASRPVSARRRSFSAIVGSAVQNAVVGGSSNDDALWAEQEARGEALASPACFFELGALSASGRDHVSFERFRDSVVLCVNVASR